MAPAILNPAPKVIRNPRFWIIVALFVGGIILHYPQQLPFGGVETPSSFLGLTRHAIERVYLLAPIIYAGFTFGKKGGIASSAVALGIMLPRAILISPSPVDALLETGGVISIGAAVNVIFHMHRREKERIRATNALLKAEEKKWRSSLNALEDMMLIIDRDYNIENINDSGLALLGKSREEVIGAKCYDIIGSIDCQTGRCPYRQSLKTKQVTSIERYEERFGRYFSIKTAPIFDENGEIVKFVDLRRDITELKRAEEALRRSEEKYRSLISNIPDVAWTSDENCRIVFISPNIERLTGYTQEEEYQVGDWIKWFDDRLHPDDMEQAQAAFRDFIKGGKPYDIEYRLKRKDEQWVWVNERSLGTYEKDGKLYADGLISDITERKRAEENLHYYLQEITRAQEEERKRIARELHDSTAQTLIALLHQLENLLGDKAKLPVREAKALWAFYEQIRDVLREVRRFSRDLRPSILDDLGLLPALEWVTGELQKEYGIEAALKVVGSERRFSPETELLIFRIVQEALRNIAKHAQASKAEVRFGFDKEKIQITISDDGIGFQPPESLGELLHAGKLGLAGIQERVQLLGGSLKLKSKIGKGTTVVASIPI